MFVLRISSIEPPSSASFCSNQCQQTDRSCPWSRKRCTILATNGDSIGRRSPESPASMPEGSECFFSMISSAHASAQRRCFCVSTILSARRRRFSTRASRSMMDMADSPIVSAAPVERRRQEHVTLRRNSVLVSKTSTIPVQLTKLTMSASVTVRPMVRKRLPTGRSSKPSQAAVLPRRRPYSAW